jgi:hypothetical protein
MAAGLAIAEAPVVLVTATEAAAQAQEAVVIA